MQIRNLSHDENSCTRDVPRPAMKAGVARRKDGRSSMALVAYEMRQSQQLPGGGMRFANAVRIDKPSVNVSINFKVNPLVV